MSESELRKALDSYATRKDFDRTNELGCGTDGLVYATTNDTAIKVFMRDRNFWNELKCYKRFRERGISKIDECDIPSLVDYNVPLRIIEIDIVKPPFLLDFGKAYVDEIPDFTPDVFEDNEQAQRDAWGDHWPAVQSNDTHVSRTRSS